MIVCCVYDCNPLLRIHCLICMYVSEGAILEKPSSPENAKEMLRSLSGRSHKVYTAVSLLLKGKQSHDHVMGASERVRRRERTCEERANV
eukprot:TRINITY_DN192_c0_g1_i1.p1 TRINITY_DN192_c0_g1~~TRINITY_DN192_c0_g1_i1.p1  ORF type:complete len:90 (-),score=2.07 TRINITY_DN192_c0_g1_i1:48-317(-)